MAQTPPSKQSGKIKPTGEDAPPQRRNWSASVGRDAGGLGAAAFMRAGFTDPALVLRWTEIAGAEVARISRPIRFSEKDGTLTLLAEPAAALFLGYETRTLAERINSYLGRSAVSRVKFVQGRLTLPPTVPLPPRAAQSVNSTDPVHGYNGPEGLKLALESLARWRGNSSRDN